MGPHTQSKSCAKFTQLWFTLAHGNYVQNIITVCTPYLTIMACKLHNLGIAGFQSNASDVHSVVTGCQDASINLSGSSSLQNTDSGSL